MTTLRRRFERAIAGCLDRATRAPCPPRLGQAMRHAVFPGGARLRPLLCMTIAGACGAARPQLAEVAAVAIELLHCASLVYDDLPCFDDAPLRRGVQAVHAAFGQAMAVLAGNALTVLAFETLAHAPGGEPGVLLALLRTVAGGVGSSSGICAGQAWESEDVVEDLAAYHRAKTGALFESAILAGALAGGDDPLRWRGLGDRLGEAYQIADDLRDACGSADALGKPVGQDTAHGRPSAVQVLGAAGCVRRIGEILADVHARIPDCPGRDSVVALVRGLESQLLSQSPSFHLSVHVSEHEKRTMTLRTLQPLHIPPFYCPIAPAVHPELERIDERSIAWFRGFGAFPGAEGLATLRGWHHPELAARAHPEEDPERVQFMADFVHWTIFDDSVVDGDHSHVSETETRAAGGFQALAVKLVRMLEAPDAPLLLESPWISSLMDLRRRLTAIATPAQTQRWIGAFREYLLAAAWKQAFRKKQALPRLADYVVLRTPDGGVQLYVTLADVIGGYQLTDADLAHPQVRALTEMALTLIAWDNDLFSHYKESLTEDPVLNLVDVIAAEQGCTLQEAVTQAMKLRDRVMHRYMVVRAQAVRRHRDSVRRYIVCLDRWIAANIDMSANSARYINPLGRPEAEATWVRFDPVRTDTPYDTSDRPLPFPAIGWWWRDDLQA